MSRNEPLANLPERVLNSCPNLCESYAELYKKKSNSISKMSVKSDNCRNYQLDQCKKMMKKVKKFKYVQPPIPCSFKPVRVYEEPNIRMADNTIYKMSFVPRNVQKPKPIYQFNNLCLSDSKMAGDTINKLSYPGWYQIKTRSPFRQCDNKIGHDGKISNDTIYKLSFPVPKIEKSEPVRPEPQLCLSDRPFDHKTVYKMSYEPNQVFDSVKPIKPQPQLCGAIGKFETNTINKLSFIPIDLLKVKRYPILPIENHNLISDSKSMNFTTVCKESYQLPGNFIELSDYSDDGECLCGVYNKENCNLYV